MKETSYSLGFLITKTGRLVTKRYEEALAQLGLTPTQSGVLSLTAADPGLTPADLVERMHSDKATISNLLSRLQKLGHIELKRAADDGRSRTVHLTASGKKIMPKVSAVDTEVSNWMASQVSQKDEAAARRFLQNIYKNT